jgi:DNA-binding GntR family transcriptional regulator
MQDQTDDDSAFDSSPDAPGASDIAYRHIRTAILTGGLPQGEILKETQLAIAIGVSRTPVREALGRLSNEGLVVLERYRRGRVASFSDGDVAEIFRLRAKLEGHGARRAATRITPEDIDTLIRIETEMEQAFDALGWHRHLLRFDQLNNEFHATIARIAQSPRLERILAGSLELPASIFNSYSEPLEDRTRRTHRQHREIIDALRARNPDWAEAAMTAHLVSIVRADPAPG